MYTTCPLRGAIAAALCVAALMPAPAAADDIDPQTLRRPRASWNQAEREFGFANWDRVFTARTVARGASVRALPPGTAWTTFAPGGDGATHLQRNIDAFKLAGIVVLHDGALRLERYALGHSADGRWVSFSVAKSVTSTLMGAAIRDGAIASVDDDVTRYLPELRGSAYDGVTLRQLLMMSSGAKWNEDYNDPAADVALFYSMPIEPGLDATVSYMKKLTRAMPPGAKWHYNTGETNLIGMVVARATKKDLATYASEKIWARYGMERDASWMVDRTGHVQGGCCLHASTRDYARLGQFILDGARGDDGQPIVPDGWLQAATRKQIDNGQQGGGYGYQWWTRDNGTFNAFGIHGQQIHIDPARRLVIAINSAVPEAVAGREAFATRQALFDAIRKAIDDEKPRGAAAKP
jgi:CubicO group peptidase (beta-lactamase class C family)